MAKRASDHDLVSDTAKRARFGAVEALAVARVVAHHSNTLYEKEAIELPREMLREIFVHIPATEVRPLAQVCREWRDVLLAKNFVEKHYQWVDLPPLVMQLWDAKPCEYIQASSSALPGPISRPINVDSVEVGGDGKSYETDNSYLFTYYSNTAKTGEKKQGKFRRWYGWQRLYDRSLKGILVRYPALLRFLPQVTVSWHGTKMHNEKTGVSSRFTFYVQMDMEYLFRMQALQYPLYWNRLGTISDKPIPYDFCDRYLRRDEMDRPVSDEKITWFPETVNIYSQMYIICHGGNVPSEPRIAWSWGPFLFQHLFVT